MSATKAYFINRYHAVTDDRYDGWFLPNGILEIGRALGVEVVNNILKGCLPPIPIPDHNRTFERVLNDMERGYLSRKKEPSLEDVTERGTSVFVLSYRHRVHSTDEFPRRRMTDEQKRHLGLAITQVASKRKSSRVILWIDQAMGQRNPRGERDWVRHGILPYFAFDILVLLEKYDLRRCWIFLEQMIAQKTSLPESHLLEAVLYEKSYQFGTISPIQEVASAVLDGALVQRAAYKENDKEQIRRWAAQLLEQDGVITNLLGGSTWKPRQYDAEGLMRVIMNHLVPAGEVQWRNISKQNTDGRFHCLSELLGLPDMETTSAGRTEVRGVMRKMTDRYKFHIFSARSDENRLVKALAIGHFLRSGRPSRTLLCALDGTENHERTCVLSSCILDCDEIRDPGALDFIKACRRFSEEKLGLWRKLRLVEDSPLVHTAKQEMRALHTALLNQLFRWARFTKAVRKANMELDCYLESIQAALVNWS